MVKSQTSTNTQKNRKEQTNRTTRTPRAKSTKIRQATEMAAEAEIVEVSRKAPRKAETRAKQNNPEPVATKPAASRSERGEKPGRERKRDTRGRYPMPAILRVLCSLVILIVTTIFFTWFVFWRTNMCDAEAALEFIREKPELAIYSFLVIFGLTAIVAAALWRPFFTLGLMFSLLSIVTFIHIEKFTLRNEPLLPEDFLLADAAGEMTSFIDTDGIVRLVTGVVCVLLGAALLEHWVRRTVGRNPKRLSWWNRTAIVPRVTFTMVALAIFGGVIKPVLNRRNPDWVEGMNLVAWSQLENYELNGFVIEFLYNMGKVTLAEPSGYSEARMAAIAEKYRAIKAADDETRVALEDEVENVVIILAETFYDPATLTKYYDHYGGDVTPNLHRLFREYPSGYMYSPEYGGGTANIEFEVQTGLTNFWTKTVPYANILTKLDSLYSAAVWSKAAGFGTTAVHSYSGSMYKRNIVYPILGYEKFIDQSGMRYTEHENESGVINDQSIYREIIDLLREADGPQLINAVTMQNHAPYQQANYPKMDFPLKQDAEEKWAIEPSFQSLHYADEYLGEFIEALDELDERTVVLWFGDHTMGLLDRYAHSDDKADNDAAHLTPYFVYANFEIESPYTVQEVKKLNAAQEITIAGVSGIDLPTTTPNCLQNTMYNILNVRKPAMFYLLDEVCAKYPILANVYYGGETPAASTVLGEYELVSYDMLVGQHYWDGE